MAEAVDMDSAGRIVLPAGHIQMAGLGREVTVAGVRDHLEVMNRSDFNARRMELWYSFPEMQRRAWDSLQRRQERQTGDSPG
jgi:DNA-binding transcriptional regulator/RsmH inhibitor MraZ